MLNRIPRPSPGLVVGLVALLFATAGTATAARKLLTGADIQNNTLSTLDIRNFSLLKNDFKKGQLPAGPRGPAGPQGLAGTPGPAGQQGPAGPPGASEVEIVTSKTDSSTQNFKSIVATCPAGKRAVGGGARLSGVDTADGPFLVRSAPGASDWTAAAREGPNFGAASTWALETFVICVKVS
jgi:hypothetical protein